MNKSLIYYFFFCLLATHSFAQKWDVFTSEKNRGSCFLIDKDESIWVGSEGGIVHYDKEYKFLQKIFFGGTQGLLGTDTSYVETLVKDKTGILWASVGNYPYGRVYAFDSEKMLQESQIPENFQPEEDLFFVDRYQKYWICYDKGTKFVQLGIDLIHTKYNWKQGGISRFMKTNITSDSMGNIWVAINSKLYKFDGKIWNSYNSQNSILPGDFFSMIKSDNKDNLLLQGWNAIYKVDMASKTKSLVPYPKNSGIPGYFFKTNDGKIKIGISNKIYDISDSTLTLVLTNNYIDSPYDHITSMIEDTKGNLLLGYRNKIVSYDGQTLKLFNSGSSLALPSNVVSQISIDEQNNIWVASNITTNPIRFNPSTKETIITPHKARLLLMDKKKQMWIGGFSEISKYDGKTWTTIKSPSSAIKKMVFDIEDNLWLLSYKSYNVPKLTELFRFKDNTWETFSLKLHINDIMPNPNNGKEVFLATTDGILTYDGQTLVKLTSKSIEIPDTINKIYADPLGVLWVFPEKSENYLLKYDGKSWSKFILPEGFIVDKSEASERFMVDSYGNLWSGTVKGLYKYDGKAVNFYNVKNSTLLNNDILTIQQAKNDKIWIGTQYGIAVLNNCKEVSPIITQQPLPQSVIEKNKATFEVVVSNVKDFQWQLSKDNGAIWNDIVSQDTLYQGQQSAKLNIMLPSSSDNGYLYRCRFSSACETEYSNPALLEVITILGSEQLLESIVKVYPNPTQDQIKIEIPQKTFKAYFLSDNGVLLKQIENQEILSVKEFSAGGYILLIDVGGVVYNKKVVIVR